jgi:D-3-phosphoglycerate dehydrogenase
MQSGKRYRIFVTGSGLAVSAQEYLLKQNCIYENGHPSDTPEDIATRLETFKPDGLIVRQGRISQAAMDAASELRVICKHGVGTDNIDIDAASARGIPVMYTPDANFESVAQHCLAMIFALARSIPSQDRCIRAGNFDKSRYNGIDLRGKTLGLVGFGRVGRRLLELFAPLDMQLLIYHPSNRDENLPRNARKVESVEAVLRGSDIVSLHCPLNEDNRGLINSRTIGLMKQGAFLINTARGELVIETDLVDALRSQKLGGAALDVFEKEPPAKTNPLFAMDNVIATSHIAGSSDQSLHNMGRKAVDNVLAILRGESIDARSLLNFTACPSVRITATLHGHTN